MRHIGTTRRFYKFSIDEPMHFIDQDVICEGNQIKFYRPDPQNKGKRTFDTPGECIDFFNQKVNKMEPIIEGAESKTLDFTKVVITKKVTDSDWGLISAFLPEGSEKNKDDFVVFSDYLCCNWMDRDKERFPKKPTLDRFNKTIIRRQKLISHSWGSYGIGRYFKSTLKKHTIDEVIELMSDSHPNPKFREHLELIQKLDGGLYWMVSGFYVPISKTEAIDDIESGIPSSSIGFIGIERKPYMDEKGKERLWTDLIPNETGEAVEGSLVGVESQYGAGAKSFGEFESGKKPDNEGIEVLGILIPFGEVTKAAENKDMHYYELSPVSEFEMISKQNTDNGEGTFYDVFYGYKENTREVQALVYPKKLWTKERAKKQTEKVTASLENPANDSQPGSSGAEKVTKKKTKSDGGFYMKFFIEALGFTKDSEIEDQKELDKVMKSINEAAEEAIEKAEANARDEIAEVKDAIIEVYENVLETKDVKPEDLEQHLKDLAERAKNGVTAREEIIEEIIKFKVDFNLVENEKGDLKTERETLSVLTMDQLTKQRDQFKSKYEKDNPGKSQLNGDSDPEKEEKKKLPSGPDGSFQEVV